jgi:hypothetical protein
LIYCNYCDLADFVRLIVDFGVEEGVRRLFVFLLSGVDITDPDTDGIASTRPELDI